MGTKLKSAPVFYTLTQFKFNPIAQMSEYVPRLQERLRRIGYPDFRPETRFAINIRRTEESQPEIQKTQMDRWSFTNAKGDEGYLLLSDSLVFHTTAYDSFEDFSKKALVGLGLVHELIELAYIDRIGLRYLDSVVAKNEEKIEVYLQPYLIGLSTTVGGKLNHSFSETLTQIENGALVARVVITESDKLIIPPDLSPLNLNILPRFSALNGRNAVLDIDYFVSERRLEGVDLEIVKAQLLASHDIITKAFHASVTDHAIKSWE